MIKRINKQDLKLGMYVHNLNCSWISHSFMLPSFLLRREADLAAIQASTVQGIDIDTAKGLDIVPDFHPEPEAALPPAGDPDPPRPDTAPGPQPRVSFQEELAEARQIKLEATRVIHALLTDVRMGRKIQVERLEPVVTRITESILRNPGTLVSLCRIRRADTFTFQHSVSVCALLVMFCHYLEMDQETLLQAGAGGMLHDIGKMRVPEHILNKPGELTEAEFEIMKSHVPLGLETLRQVPGISEPVLQVAGQHHERVQGSGYPGGLQGPEISRLGRIAAIVDVYDAITSLRIYHQAIEPAEALQQLFQMSNSHFDEDLVQHFIRAIGIYPVGSLVRLASSRLAVVLEQNQGGLMSPKVRIVYDLRRSRALPPHDLDLAGPEAAGDSIVGHERPGEWNLDPNFYLNLEVGI